MKIALIVSLIVNVIFIVLNYITIIEYDKLHNECNKSNNEWAKICEDINNKWYETCARILNKTNKEE